MADGDAHAELDLSGRPAAGSAPAPGGRRWWQRRGVQLGGVGVVLLLVLGATLGRPAPKAPLDLAASARSGTSSVSAAGSAADSPASTPASTPDPEPAAASVDTAPSAAPPEPALTAAAAPASISRPEQATAVLGRLAGLPVKGRAPRTGYSRADFGDAWTDDVTVGGRSQRL